MRTPQKHKTSSSTSSSPVKKMEILNGDTTGNGGTTCEICEKKDFSNEAELQSHKKLIHHVKLSSPGKVKNSFQLVVSIIRNYFSRSERVIKNFLPALKGTKINQVIFSQKSVTHRVVNRKTQKTNHQVLWHFFMTTWEKKGGEY